jgi:hypothetical protein
VIGGNVTNQDRRTYFENRQSSPDIAIPPIPIDQQSLVALFFLCPDKGRQEARETRECTLGRLRTLIPKT